MKTKCPNCGVKFDRATVQTLEMFSATVIGGGTATCASCGKNFSMNYIASSGLTDPGLLIEEKKWWQFWKR